MPAVTNTICAGEMVADLVDHLLGGGAADLGLDPRTSMTCTPSG
jgi:hypothetical protein